MQFNPSTEYIVILLLLIAVQVYCSLHFSKMIWCTFRTVDRTRITKWAKATQTVVEFDGGRYEVEPSRITFGIKWLLLPMSVKCLDFRHDSSRALDPDTFENTYTPEQRVQLDIKDDVKGFNQGNQQSLSARGLKQGLMQQYLPLIVLVGFLICGYLIWQQRIQTDKLGFGINVVQEQLGRILQNMK